MKARTRTVFEARDDVTGDDVAVGVDRRGALVIWSKVEGVERVLVLASPESGRRLRRALAEAPELDETNGDPARRRSSPRRVTL